MMENMVEVREAYKRYGSQLPILQGLNMSVKKGTIYGLLGPSGCGKTTLLSSIVGKQNVDSGQIRVGITSRKQLGYMPQDVALFLDLTIDEIFIFYGKLYEMPAGLVKRRSEELSKMLDFPPSTRFIENLSGGQQRRVSFAVALLHSPSLIILDEPTVGMDPILCSKIWEYLVKLARDENKTIVITTHYIEEARQSNTIGLMREGVLLSEESPKQLMENQNCNNLEQAFLELSKKQHELQKPGKHKAMQMGHYPSNQPKPLRPLKSKEWFVFSRFEAQLTKNIKWVQRNIAMLIFIVVLPAVQSYIYCAAFGHDPEHLQFGVVSEELRGFVKSCDELPYNETYSEILDCNVPRSFSCQFMKKLETRLDVILYDDLQTGKRDVARNKIWGVLHVPKNFTNSISERIGDGLVTNEGAIDQSFMSVWMDMSNFIIANIIKKDLAKSLLDFLQEVLVACNIPKKVGDIPVKFNEAVFGSNDPVYRNSGAAGFVCAFVFYFTMTFTSGAVMMDKMHGLIDRITVAGMTNLEIILAHLVVQSILMTAQVTLMLLVLYQIYDNPLNGSLALTVSLMYGICFVGITCGYFLSELLNEERLISYAGIGLVMTMLLINGTLWPMEGAHDTLKAWSKGFPIVAPAESYNSITFRGSDVTHKEVYLGFVSCVAWAVIFTLTTYWLTRRKKGD